MKIFHFLRREAGTPLRRLAVATVVSGAANTLLLVLINTAVQNAVSDEHSTLNLVLFVLVTTLYISAQNYLMSESFTEVEQILQRIRMRVADKVRMCDLEPLETLGRSQVYASLSRETQIISQASEVLVQALQSAVLILFAVAYLAWLSLATLVGFAAVAAVAVVFQARNIARYQRGLSEAMTSENQVLDTFTHFFDGFIEIKMNPRRSDDLLDHLRRMSESVAVVRIGTKRQLANMLIFGQTMIYVLVATMIFAVPALSSTYNEVIVQAATAMLFLTGPLTALSGATSSFGDATAAIERLESLQATLDRSIRRRGGSPEARIETFGDLRLEGVVFRFHHTLSERPFIVGPVKMTLGSGETVFVCGGNGSGKSTFLRLLTGLYDPDQGTIRVGGEEVGEDNLQAYRNLFSVVFSDFHLFDRLYGMEDVEEERVTALLEEMDLAHEVSYSGGKFSDLELSTGQKKRLAYVVSRLEDRPIYVFDEWAADQDPEFRKKFYDELLPELKRHGKTVLAVTHDDRYWEVSDRLLKMEEGRFVKP